MLAAVAALAALALPTLRRATGLLDGRHKSVLLGHGQDFDDLSPYRPGDDVTDIDWKSPEIALPAFLTIIMMPFSYSITNGIGAGFIAYLVVPGAAGRLVSASVGRMCAISILVAVLGGWLGMRLMLVPTPHPVSPQAAVVLSIVALLVLIIAGLKIYTVLRKIMAPKVKASTEGELQGAGAQ